MADGDARSVCSSAMGLCPSCFALYSARLLLCPVDGTPLSEEDDDRLIGRELCGYRIIERVGDGAMGRVYRAVSPSGRDRALKLLFRDYATQKRTLERFRREALALAAIDHPNIVAIHEFTIGDDGLAFIVMEMVVGSTLEAIIANEGKLSPSRAADVARQVALGLGAAHALGFVHRDVKPSNVMIVSSGDIGRIKVVDFGVVGIRQQLQGRLTLEGQVVGTPAYMAPEQVSDGMIAPQTDLYALGAVLYEMLSGKPPFDGRDTTGVLFHHLTVAPPPLEPCGGLELLVESLLEKDPANRPRNAKEVVEAIDALGVACGDHTTDLNALKRVQRSEPKTDPAHSDPSLRDTNTEIPRPAIIAREPKTDPIRVAELFPIRRQTTTGDFTPIDPYTQFDDGPTDHDGGSVP
jgi:eukaryotic-like serine/threonine-protein kinase